MARRDRAVYGGLLIVRAEISRAEGDSWSLRKALADVLEALRWVDPKDAPQIHLAGVSVLSVLVVRVGTSTDARDVLQLANEADERLRSKLSAGHPHRLKLRGIRALAIAKLGITGDMPQRLLVGVIRGLHAAGLDSDAEAAKADLLWILERGGSEEHARWRGLRRQMGLPPVSEPESDDPEEPIGF